MHNEKLYKIRNKKVYIKINLMKFHMNIKYFRNVLKKLNRISLSLRSKIF